MIWLFVIFLVLAFSFIKLGALSLMVKMLSGALSLAIMLAGIFVFILIWKKIKQ